MAYPNRPESGPVLYWYDDGVAHIRFNRPHALNAIDEEMAACFHQACQVISNDSNVRVVWISAEGRAFMAGGDIASMSRDPEGVAERLIRGIHSGLQILSMIDAPVIATVHGAVAGGGLGLVLGAADIILAAKGTRFGVAYPLIGASCDCSTSWSLPRRVGLTKALELSLLGESIDADEALRLGLCNRIMAAEDLEDEGRNLVERLAVGPTKAYGQIRRLVRTSHQNDLRFQLDAEAAGFRTTTNTADFREGVSAFLSKRKPSFKGN